MVKVSKSTILPALFGLYVFCEIRLLRSFETHQTNDLQNCLKNNRCDINHGLLSFEH